MYRPFLFVGLGGSGGKTLRFVKKELQLWLENVAPGESLPDCWKFLHIDSPTQQDGGELNPYVDMLDQDEYLGLVGPGVSFNAIANGLDAIQGMQHELVGWRIDAAAMDVPIGIGAGQYRAIGRTIAMLHGKQIRAALSECAYSMSSPQARNRLEELYVQSNDAAPGPHSDPIVIVVSSLAGGTGAGLLMTVFDLLASVGVGKGEIIGVLYTPEVFGAEGTSDGNGGVFANSLAAISEVLNGHWFHGGQKLGYRQPADLKNAGAAQSLKRSGPAYPFLVGMKNATGTSFSSSKDLFEMVGASLASWVTDKSIQDSLVGYTLGNWDQNAAAAVTASDVLINKGDPSEWGKPAINALGVARLSIGHRYFMDYATARVARDAASFLARVHIDGAEARQIMRTEGVTEPTELAHLIAKRRLHPFLSAAHLAEKGREENQVLDALKPDDAESIEQRFEEQVRQLLSSTREESQDRWRELILNATKASIPDFLSEYTAGVRTSVTDWCAEAPERVCSIIADEIARGGLQIAQAQVAQAVDYFTAPNGVIEELRAERTAFQNAGTDSAIADIIYEDTQRLSSRGKISSSHPDISTAIQGAVYCAGNRVDAIVREQAVTMLDSFANDFLRPLSRALASAAASLDQSIQQDALTWPEWHSGPPPKHMEPPASEVTLIEPDEYAELFDQLLRADIKAGAEATETQLREDIRHAVISGAFLEGPDAPQIERAKRKPTVQMEREWWPGQSVVPEDTRTSQTAYFAINVDPGSLRARADWWMNRPNRAFTRLRKESLRTYLQEDTTFRNNDDQTTRETYERRQREFVPKLNQALDSAAPLVSIDPVVAASLGITVNFDRIVTQMPFANIAGFEDRVRETLASRMVKEVDFTSASEVQEISISSFLSAPVQPLVVQSLLRPISENWVSASQSNVGISAFWNRRRARRLDEFIPAPQETISAMVRGWFTGMVLGLIRVERDSGSIKIGRLHQAPAEFPNPRLDQSPDNRDSLPIVLESLALAYVEVSRRGDLSPLAAYCELRDLGMSSDDSVIDYGQSRSVNKFLRDWIMTGSLPDDLQIGKCRLEWENPSQAKGAIQSELHRVSERYQEDFEVLQREWNASPYRIGQPPLWPGIMGHITTSLETLHRAVLNLDIADTPDY